MYICDTLTSCFHVHIPNVQEKEQIISFNLPIKGMKKSKSFHHIVDFPLALSLKVQKTNVMKALKHKIMAYAITFEKGCALCFF